jgi:hypothetical protein
MVLTHAVVWEGSTRTCRALGPKGPLFGARRGTPSPGAHEQLQGPGPDATGAPGSPEPRRNARKKNIEKKKKK